MTAIFADTFYWVALTDSTDSAHQAAIVLALAREVDLIVTTDEVLVASSFWQGEDAAHAPDATRQKKSEARTSASIPPFQSSPTRSLFLSRQTSICGLRF